MINLNNTRVFVAGDDTLIGEAVSRLLRRDASITLVGGGELQPDLTDKAAVDSLFQTERPDYVIYAGGRSGGIAANVNYPASLMYDNLMSATHVIHASHEMKVRKLLFLASSCSYPRLCPQPMTEDQLLTGPLEPTNEAYAVAKLAGIKLCQSYRREFGDDFIVGIPANSYGINDDFSPENSHVVGALIRRAHEAKIQGQATLTVWGTGNARREFLFADDLADACVYLLQNYSDEMPVNLAGGTDVSIRELAGIICEITGFKGELVFDTTKPDGMPLKALDPTRLLSLGWSSTTSFSTGLEATYKAFLAETTVQEARI